MSDVIEFFFEYVSPYAYIAAKQIEEVGKKHGKEVIWRPVSLGHVWKSIGATNVGPGAVSQKAQYLMQDSARFAKMAGLEMSKPAVFPVDAKLARLAFYRLSAQDKDLGKAFAQGIFDKFWAKSEEITEPEHLEDLAKELKVDLSEIAEALTDADAKAAMIASTQAAIDCGAFGMPWFKYGEQVFWGADRIPHIDQYLAFKAA
ncbi:2-hydroxychromene-2-carboxylate isomerase [Sneathiella sp.]|jgi:2-hydroxychromene-2-carboxylate isomerase|uniref:2-hydroxychromene-2-carboxylate isomerase n=1 Tax=Sneathiella sp. TaxID=1964365 RepID=UPI0039E57A5A